MNECYEITKQILAYHILDQTTLLTLKKHLFTVQLDYNFIHTFDINTRQFKIGIINVCLLNEANDIFEHKWR